MKRFVLLVCALGAAAACGDNLPGDDDHDHDAVQIDAPSIDAQPTDAGIDAAPLRYTGTVTVIEGAVLAPSPAPANTFIGQGIQLGVTFTDLTTAIAPVLDTQPGSLFGCKVTEIPVAQLGTTIGINEGTVTFTVNNGGTPANPVFPTCVFATGAGYLCPDTGSSQAITATNTVTLTQLSASASLMTVVGTATFDGEDIGRYVKFAGTGQAAFDASFASFAIVATGAACTGIIGAACTSGQAVIGVGIPVATLPFTAGSLTTLGGVGPMPMLPDPGQLADSASVTAVLTPGGGNHFPVTTITFGNVGDDFSVDDTNANIIRGIPTDGSAFSVTCGSTCGSSVGTVLNITTTDANLTGISSPFAMPPPATKRVSIRCAELSGTINVPANVSAYLMNSGATRIQTNFVRANFGAPNPASEGLSAVIGGHAIVGFTTP